jgi:hypothetical protein
MTDAVTNLHAIEKLLTLVNTGPGANAAASKEAKSVLFRLGQQSRAAGYTAEKLAAVRDDIETWFSPRNWLAYGDDPQVFKARLLRDIEHLKKALARKSEGQD